MDGVGTHLLAELFDCDEFHINNVKKVEEIMLAAAELTGATIIKPFFYKFSPYGISGVLVIAESHFTIHTWPEYGYAAFDIFTCGELNAHIALKHVKKELGAGSCSVLEMKRGIESGERILNRNLAFKDYCKGE